MEGRGVARISVWGGSSSNVLSTSSHFTAGGGPRKLAKGAHMVRCEFRHPNMSPGLGYKVLVLFVRIISREARKNWCFTEKLHHFQQNCCDLRGINARSARKNCNLGPSCTLLAPPSSSLCTGPPDPPPFSRLGGGGGSGPPDPTPGDAPDGRSWCDRGHCRFLAAMGKL